MKIEIDEIRLLLDNDTQEQSIIAFAATENLIDFSEAEQIYVYLDGTFYTRPFIFHQIYTVHTNWWVHVASWILPISTLINNPRQGPSNPS